MPQIDIENHCKKCHCNIPKCQKLCRSCIKIEKEYKADVERIKLSERGI